MDNLCNKVYEVKQRVLSQPEQLRRDTMQATFNRLSAKEREILEQRLTKINKPLRREYLFKNPLNKQVVKI